MTNDAWGNWQAGSMRDIYPDDNDHDSVRPPAKASLRDELSGNDRILFDIIEELFGPALDAELERFDALCLSGGGEEDAA